MAKSATMNRAEFAAWMRAIEARDCARARYRMTGTEEDRQQADRLSRRADEIRDGVSQ